MAAALTRGGPVITLYVWSPQEEGAWPPGGASRWWLHQSLAALDGELRARGNRLILRQDAVIPTVRELAREMRVDAVYWNRRYEPAVVERNQKLKTALKADGIAAESFNAALLFEPWDVQNKSGKPFQVFTPFWKSCLAAKEPSAPLPAPEKIPAPAKWPESLPLEALKLEPAIRWAEGMRVAWQPGESGARERLARFLKQAALDYTQNRNVPGIEGTSRLSPHLHFGEIGPRQIWHAIAAAASRRGIAETSWKSWQYVAEIGWREFAYHLLYHFPHTPAEPLRHEFAQFAWNDNAAQLKAWKKGRTGYPLVDAGMRELWTTGWMHNRVRMVVASFLVKHLLIGWQRGAAWFWDTLVDADLASNTLGWQWTAGCGADAAPYFRVFNPVTQGEKFDPNGDYVRRWVPELAALPPEWIHKPWAAPAQALRQAGLTLDKTYPRPIVDHAAARARALEAYSQLKE